MELPVTIDARTITVFVSAPVRPMAT
jgi:hypothetical protein